jgi:hypothetical protein
VKKTKAGKLTFKPVLTAKLTRSASIGDQFAAALHAADHVTLIESSRMITFKLRKRRKDLEAL